MVLVALLLAMQSFEHMGVRSAMSGMACERALNMAVEWAGAHSDGCVLDETSGVGHCSSGNDTIEFGGCDPIPQNSSDIKLCQRITGSLGDTVLSYVANAPEQCSVMIGSRYCRAFENTRNLLRARWIIEDECGSSEPDASRVNTIVPGNQTWRCEFSGQLGTTYESTFWWNETSFTQRVRLDYADIFGWSNFTVESSSAGPGGITECQHVKSENVWEEDDSKVINAIAGVTAWIIVSSVSVFVACICARRGCEGAPACCWRVENVEMGEPLRT
jgi:hypothetical protein